MEKMGHIVNKKQYRSTLLKVWVNVRPLQVCDEARIDIRTIPLKKTILSLRKYQVLFHGYAKLHVLSYLGTKLALK